MCCFSGRRGAVVKVEGTRIFARAAGGAEQVLVYEMKVAFREPVAMVLPLPVAPGRGDHAVRFVSLEGYTRFFDDLDMAFPSLTLGLPKSQSLLSRRVGRQSSLVVHQVGDFVASYVPGREDFERLDPRFRLAPGVLDALPQVSDWGFAVFQLATRDSRSFFAKLLGAGKPPTARVHPMALLFPRRDPSRLFFPTIHVHDGQVHPRAHFDHALYAQLSPGSSGSSSSAIPGESWVPAFQQAEQVMRIEQCRDLVLAGAPLFKQSIVGEHSNQDSYLPL